MTQRADPRLVRLLGGADLAELRQRLRRRYELADADSAPSSVRLSNLTTVEYTALSQLSGRPSRATRSISVDIAELDQRLHAAGLCSSLKEALEQLDGPILAKASLRKALTQEWSTLVAGQQHGSLLQAWLRSSAGPALLKRLSRRPQAAERLLLAADAVLQRLPCTGLARSQLAAETLGDAHGLDAGRAVATLVLAAWRVHEQASSVESLDAGDADSEERQREVWSRAGVLVNELARPALALNLPSHPEVPSTWRDGEPTYLSLRQLVRVPYPWRVQDVDIYVCENPNVVAIAADHLGIGCAPLVCTDGMPSAAQRLLLDQLVSAGAKLHYHGDFDWAGIGIGNHVMRTWKAVPWQFGREAYEQGLSSTPEREHDLAEVGMEASWDDGLCTMMRARGLSIAEEAVMDGLLQDLRRPRTPSAEVRP